MPPVNYTANMCHRCLYYHLLCHTYLWPHTIRPPPIQIQMGSWRTLALRGIHPEPAELRGEGGCPHPLFQCVDVEGPPCPPPPPTLTPTAADGCFEQPSAIDRMQELLQPAAVAVRVAKLQGRSALTSSDICG